MKTTRILPLLLLSALALPVFGTANEPTNEDPPALINLPEFREILNETEAHRAKRRVSLERFQEMSREPNTLILDTRSKAAYDQKHLKGAVHLNFSDFTADKLAKVIPDKATRILIYCNNNVKDDPASFALKGGPLALNIPTYINLYGYGYRNVFELKSLIAENDSRWEFEGTAVDPS